MRRLTALVLVVLSLFAAPPSVALPRARADGVADEAEVNFRLGTERYAAADYRAALAYFLASNRLAPNRHVRFNIARAFQRLGEFPEAHRWCTEALAGEDDPALRAQLEETLRSIEREVAVLAIETTPPGATVYLDRADLGSVATTPTRLAVREGEHRVIVRLAGYHELVSEPLQVARGQTVLRAFSLRRIVGVVEVSAALPTEVHGGGPDGELLCTTPCRLELPPGAHPLTFVHPGHRARSEAVQVAEGATVQVRADTTPRTGSLVVTADERDAQVEIDGVPQGFTPVVVRSVATGVRRVRVTLHGFEPIERTVEIREDQQAELRDLSLLPSREVTAASRRRQSIDEAPASVSIVSAQELEAFRYPTVYEALRGQRGVVLSDDGAYAGVTLRGLGQPGDYGNRMLVLTDGATLNDDILWQSYVGFDGRVDLDDLDRIELVRGAGSVLYGTGAVSGVVNLIPREPSTRASVSGRVSAVDPRIARGRAAGGLAFGRDGGLTLSLAGAHGEGERVRLPEPVSRAVDGVRSFDAATGQARLVYGALHVQLFATTRRQFVPQGAYGAIVGDRYNHLEDTRGLVEARYEPTLNERVQLFVRAFGNLYRFEAAQAFGTSDARSLGDEHYRGLGMGAEGRVLVRLYPNLRLTAGAELVANVEASLRGTLREAGTRQRYLDESEPYRTYAAYALAEWEPSRYVSTTAGARLDAWSTFGLTVNPRFAVLIHPRATTSLKLMAGRAFRAPSIYELRYSDGGLTQRASDYGGNELKPELAWQGEAEFTERFGDGWSALASAHLQHAENFILLVPTGESGKVFYDNGGNDVRIYGGDLEARREFRAGWMFAASYGVLVARYVHPREGSTRVPNVPTQLASVRGVVPLLSSVRLAARATLEAPRRIATDRADETHAGVIADLVLTGDVPRAGLDYALGLYNLFDFRASLPTESTFRTGTMPQSGRALLVSLGISR